MDLEQLEELEIETEIDIERIERSVLPPDPETGARDYRDPRDEDRIDELRERLETIQQVRQRLS